MYRNFRIPSSKYPLKNGHRSPCRKQLRIRRRLRFFYSAELGGVELSGVYHLRIEKQVRDGRTTTSVVHLNAEERTLEIARLLAGEKITDSALTHAAEMLRSASQN